MSNMPQFPQKEIKPIPPAKKSPPALLNQKYMLPVDKIHEVYEDGNVVGIECSLLISLYHGSPLSMIRSIKVKYDALEYENDPMKFTVNGHTYNFEEMKTMSTMFWEYGEYAQLFIPIPGGVGLGRHRLEVGIAFNGSATRGINHAWAVAEINLIEN